LSAPAPTSSRRTRHGTRRRTWLGLLIPALLVFAALLSLGTWQLRRKAWKEDLIATLAERLAAPPSALPVPSTWPRLDRAGDEYRRVKFSAQFEPGKAALVFATASAFRPDVSGFGFWVFAPARLADGGVVIVNRGFVPTKLADPNVRYDEPRSGMLDITGVMRWSDTRQWFTPKDNPAQNVWFVRDPAVIAAAKDWGSVSPFYVEQESPSPESGWPRPGKIVVNLPNNHLQYAVTWYGLALALAAVYLVFVGRQVRQRRDPE
jgi:surfeit locus 1 family protein